MTEFSILSPEPEEEYTCPNPAEKSTIVFILDGDYDKESYGDFPGFEVMEIQYEGGAAEYEVEHGVGITYPIGEMIDCSSLKKNVWYIMKGFESHFSKDYYGEVDCDHYFDEFREATKEEVEHFGVKFDEVY
jgi:hypothetical protein